MLADIRDAFLQSRASMIEDLAGVAILFSLLFFGLSLTGSF